MKGMTPKTQILQHCEAVGYGIQKIGDKLPSRMSKTISNICAMVGMLVRGFPNCHSPKPCFSLDGQKLGTLILCGMFKFSEKCICSIYLNWRMSSSYTNT